MASYFEIHSFTNRLILFILVKKGWVLEMNKILTLSDNEKLELLNWINATLSTRNRLLQLVLMNPDKKGNILERRKKQSRYEEQIYLLENLRGMVHSCSSREDVQRINSLIGYYKSIEQ